MEGGVIHLRAVAAFDHLYLPRLHRKGVVAPDVGSEAELVASPSGQVLESLPGLYRDVLSFDFRSPYPRIIRTIPNRSARSLAIGG